jgi:hypothetical protein
MNSDKIAFDNDTDSFICTITLEGTEVPISVLDLSQSEMDTAKSLSDQYLKWLSENLSSIKAFAAEELIELKNNNWLEESEGPIAESDFVAAVVVEGVNIFSDGSSEVYLGDGDLFGGHSISVSVSPDYQLTAAAIVG